MPRSSPRFYLLHIQDSCERLLECRALRDRGVFPAFVLLDAACRNLEILGEAARKAGPEFRAAHPEIPWREMSDLRNVLIHNYEGTDAELVWGIVDREIPRLLADTRRLLESGVE
jgi:uncharacterized protein with HEPN domain